MGALGGHQHCSQTSLPHRGSDLLTHPDWWSRNYEGGTCYEQSTLIGRVCGWFIIGGISLAYKLNRECETCAADPVVHYG